jgi:hypothetical protein
MNRNKTLPVIIIGPYNYPSCYCLIRQQSHTTLGNIWGLDLYNCTSYYCLIRQQCHTTLSNIRGLDLYNCTSYYYYLIRQKCHGTLKFSPLSAETCCPPACDADGNVESAENQQKNKH